MSDHPDMSCSSLRRAIYVLILLLLSPLVQAQTDQEKIRVTFLNPGWASESFWGDVDSFMLAMAERLDIELRIIHGNRNVFRILELGERLKSEKSPPDYVFLVNELNTGPRLLTMMGHSSAKILFLLNDLTPEQKKAFGQPRIDFSNWLGALIPDNHWVGYQTARKMHEAMRRNTPEQEAFRWLAISGDPLTPASIRREAGMRDYVAANPDIELINVVYGEWNELKAVDLTRALLRRSTNIDGLWTANDHMAFGAITALDEFGLEPGRDVFIGTVNSSPKVLDYLDRGLISALGAGHFTAGGWALLLAYDDFHGHDILADGTVLKQALFDLIEPGAESYELLSGRQWNRVPIETYSQTLNEQWKGYRFSLDNPLTSVSP